MKTNSYVAQAGAECLQVDNLLPDDLRRALIYLSNLPEHHDACKANSQALRYPPLACFEFKHTPPQSPLNTLPWAEIDCEFQYERVLS